MKTDYHRYEKCLIRKKTFTKQLSYNIKKDSNLLLFTSKEVCFGHKTLHGMICNLPCSSTGIVEYKNNPLGFSIAYNEK